MTEYNWEIKQSLPNATQYAAVAEHNGKIYVMGGRDSSGHSDDLQIYNISQDSWSIGTSLPNARHRATAVEFNDYIYLIAGFRGTSYLDEVDRYDPNTDSWETNFASKPTAVRGNQLGATDGNKIYMPGGTVSGTNESDQLEAYDPNANSWETLQSLPVTIRQNVVVYYNGFIWTYGGDPDRRDLLQYDISANSWDQKANLNNGRHAHGGAVYNDEIYALMGETDVGGKTGDVEKYDPEIDSWDSDIPDNPNGRDALTSVSYQNWIFTIGGRDANNDSVDSHEALVITEDPEATGADRIGISTSANLAGYSGEITLFEDIDGDGTADNSRTVELFDGTTDLTMDGFDSNANNSYWTRIDLSGDGGGTPEIHSVSINTELESPTSIADNDINLPTGSAVKITVFGDTNSDGDPEQVEIFNAEDGISSVNLFEIDPEVGQIWIRLDLESGSTPEIHSIELSSAISFEAYAMVNGGIEQINTGYIMDAGQPVEIRDLFVQDNNESKQS